MLKRQKLDGSTAEEQVLQPTWHEWPASCSSRGYYYTFKSYFQLNTLLDVKGNYLVSILLSACVNWTKV